MGCHFSMELEVELPVCTVKQLCSAMQSDIAKDVGREADTNPKSLIRKGLVFKCPIVQSMCTITMFSHILYRLHLVKAFFMSPLKRNL